MAHAFEHPCHRAGSGQVAAVAVERGADVADGAVAVVGQAFDDKRNAAGGIAFIDDFFKGYITKFASTLFNRTFDIGVRHVDCSGRGQGGTESRIGVAVAAAHFGGNHDFLG